MGGELSVLSVFGFFLGFFCVKRYQHLISECNIIIIVILVNIPKYLLDFFYIQEFIPLVSFL